MHPSIHPPTLSLRRTLRASGTEIINKFLPCILSVFVLKNVSKEGRAVWVNCINEHRSYIKKNPHIFDLFFKNAGIKNLINYLRVNYTNFNTTIWCTIFTGSINRFTIDHHWTFLATTNNFNSTSINTSCYKEICYYFCTFF